ncbi:hypothetical protein NDU88_004362 [Pleurodeles waltl]|uniref:Uncharacterized protein n=1 Tax=Pleurodeles waltl TaxID=8319 RepID=A0AAV7UF99_PLEWA|nr:hypothetical protein NDU88_004362 [Pleurodeles waltl]
MQRQRSSRKFEARPTGSMYSRAERMQPDFQRGTDAVTFLQEDGPEVGLVAAVEPVHSVEEEAEEEDIDNQNNIIMQYFQ